jgi:copper(I)-binding protein
VALAAAFLTATGSGALAADIKIEKPWMRLIIKARPAGGFFTLHNGTGKAVTLTAASSSACGTIMVHETKEVDGISKMMHVEGVKVPAGGTVTFKPGGYHLMCMKPRMEVGKRVPVTLKFADGTTITAQFPVTGPAGLKK